MRQSRGKEKGNGRILKSEEGPLCPPVTSVNHGWDSRHETQERLCYRAVKKDLLGKISKCFRNV